MVAASVPQLGGRVGDQTTAPSPFNEIYYTGQVSLAEGGKWSGRNGRTGMRQPADAHHITEVRLQTPFSCMMIRYTYYNGHI